MIPKILNGNRARRALFTYHVGIYNSIEGNTHPICGGVVLSENYIITAAHCVDDYSSSSYFVILGDYSITDKNDGQERFEIAEIKIHPDYDSSSSTKPNDIALLRLSSSAKFNERIGQICLPSETGNFLCEQINKKRF